MISVGLIAIEYPAMEYSPSITANDSAHYPGLSYCLLIFFFSYCDGGLLKGLEGFSNIRAVALIEWEIKEKNVAIV